MSQTVTPDLLALDIGARKHHFALQAGSHQQQGELANDPAVLRAFLTAQLRRGRPLRLLVEATGIYYLDVALLAVALGIEVMVINPKAAHNFAKALQRRSKTDPLDAQMLLEFLKRMPFSPWHAPRQSLLELRHYGRYLVQLTEEATAAKNRLHALQSTQASPRLLRTDLQRAIASLERRITRIRAAACALLQTDADLQPAFAALTSMCGVGQTSAIALLSELAVLPAELNSRACVCHAGLDVRLYQSGSSVLKASRISRHGNKYLRRALFMPAMTAAQHDPNANAFYQRLLSRGKTKMQAIVALMRKLLTAAWALVRQPAPYNSSRLFTTPQKA